MEENIQETVVDEKTYTGTVIWFSKGMGFIDWEKDGQKQTDMFCHHSSILMEGYRNLRKGQAVSFQIGVNHTGRPKAINVQVLTKS